MNRIYLIENKRGEMQRHILNGVEVNRDVWFKAVEQNERIRKRRQHLRAGTFVRHWNKLDPRNKVLLKAIERSAKGTISKDYGYAYRVSL